MKYVQRAALGIHGSVTENKTLITAPQDTNNPNTPKGNIDSITVQLL
jgi:hypothetical protein